MFQWEGPKITQIHVYTLFCEQQNLLSYFFNDIKHNLFFGYILPHILWFLNNNNTCNQQKNVQKKSSICLFFWFLSFFFEIYVSLSFCSSSSLTNDFNLFDKSLISSLFLGDCVCVIC